MKYLLDTNVISEGRKAYQNPHVQEWFQSQEEESLYISALTVGEIVYGIEKLPPSEHKTSLSLWLSQTLLPGFSDRVLPVDERVTQTWGRLRAQHRVVPAVDGLIAATAYTHSLVVVTRNIKDFHDLPVQVFNPWES